LIGVKLSLALFIASLALVLINHHASRLEPPQTDFVKSWSMGYWTGANGVPVSDLEWGGLTHVAHVAVAPNRDGSLTFTCSFGPCSRSQFATEANDLISTAHANSVKVLLDIGNVSGSLWLGATTNNLAGFVNNIVSVVNTYGYDGVDLDWEQGFNQSLMTSLLAALRPQLTSKLLTSTAGGDTLAYFATVQAYLDRINAMTYDMVGNWNRYSWFNSALYSDPCSCVWSLDLTRIKALAAHIQPAKLNLGLAFYGSTSQGGSPTISGPRQTWSSGPSLGQINYNLIANNYNITNPNWDSVSQTPWISTSNGWITFDNERSLVAKVNYVKSNNLGGWIIWALDQDYFPTKMPKHPLLTAVKNAMKTDRQPLPGAFLHP